MDWISRSYVRKVINSVMNRRRSQNLPGLPSKIVFFFFFPLFSAPRKGSLGASVRRINKAGDVAAVHTSSVPDVIWILVLGRQMIPCVWGTGVAGGSSRVGWKAFRAQIGSADLLNCAVCNQSWANQPPRERISTTSFHVQV